MKLEELPPSETFRASDGHGLGFRHYRHARPADVSLAVVLIHGAGCFGDQMHAMATAIAENCCSDVYTLDMRGHGLSEGTRGRAVKGPSQLVGDIAEFSRFLRAQPASPRVVVGGHSAGGGLVLALARSPAAVDIAGFLFIAPFLGLGSGVDRPHFGGWVALRPWPLRMIAVANLFGITWFNDLPVVDFNMAAPAPDQRYVPHWSFSTLLAFGPGCWSPDQPPIDGSKPVLVVAGSEDECFFQPLYQTAFACIAPHASIPPIGTAGHWDVLVDPTSLAETTKWLRTFSETLMSTPALPPVTSPSITSQDNETVETILRVRQWRRKTSRAGVAALLALLSHGHALADPTPPAPAPPPAADQAFVRLGVAGVIFEPDVTFRVEGQKLPGAQTGLSSNVTLSGEAGYYVTPHISLSVTGGVPPKTQATGEGSIAAQGVLGSVRYGTIVGLAEYHFNKSGRFQPWIGAGPAFLLVLSSEGAALQNLKVSNRWAAAVQVGANYMFSPRWGLFASATQNFVGSEGQGNFGPYSVLAKLTLNPVALQAGVELRF